MKLKMKHLRHPLRTTTLVRKVASLYLEIKRFGDSSQRHFQGDPRYDLANVTNGFASRVTDASGDAELLERICAAYNKAIQREEAAREMYRPTEWWQLVRRGSLGPVTRALQAGDIDALGRMYGNFFRDPCGDGLIGAPYGIAKAYLGSGMKNLHRRYYLGDALYLLDYWTEQTEGRFFLSDLAGPEIGNPFGVVLDGTLVRTGSPYQHYCAQRASGYLDSETGTLVEIGGGFGGMAYYLLRDRPGVKYLDFDVPESIALASYYLMKAFPQLDFLLYGEKPFTAEEIDRADVVLMPLFEMENLPSGSVDVAFSSHAVSDLSHEVIGGYLETIARFTKKYFVDIGKNEAAHSISEAARTGNLFHLEETRNSAWYSHRFPEFADVESVYRAVTHEYGATEYARSASENACL